MQLFPYLIFNGNAGEAMAFYQQILGGELTSMRFSEMPDFEKHPNPDDRDRVMNAQLRTDNGVLMASDSSISWPAGPMDGFSVALVFDDVDRAKSVFEALSSGGVTTMPWSATFWAEGFGMLTDKFGVTWMVSSEMTSPASG